jgi:Undecaprenyl-phosphate glucose phosphotransferase
MYISDTAQATKSVIRQSRAARARVLFSCFAAAADATAIVASAAAVSWLYHWLVLGDMSGAENQLQIGAAIALLMLVPAVVRRDYDIARFLDFRGHADRAFQLWNAAFIAAITLSFLAKTSVVYSRGAVVLFYFVGFVLFVATRFLLVRLVQVASKTGTVTARRILLVGHDREIVNFARTRQPWNIGMEIVGVGTLPETSDAAGPAFRAALDEAVQRARLTAPDDIFLLLPWDRRQAIERSVDGFLTIPASIHLGAETVIDRFQDIRVERIGDLTSMQIVRRPLSTADIAMKRSFDLALASIALVLLAPVLAAVALAIRLDSPGPVFFRQRRYGFNQRPFRIFKFRTMHVLEDGPEVTQARVNDPRVTRVGRWLRRWNIDELPQLLNVLLGHMSLVGPRPHALAHDHAYERRISLYARRHNVRPGITGWAQVNGFRGETSTDEKMRGRIDHDLHYIDHWSLWLDLKILFLTVFSRTAYRNAA